MSQFLVGNAGPVLFTAIFVEQMGIPLPAAPLLVAAGTLAADGAISPGVAMGVTLLACTMADLIWYYVGRRGGGGLFRFICKLCLFDNSSFARTERLFAKYGMSAVVGAKFVPALGPLIPSLAGAFRIPPGRFLCFDLLGSLLYGIFFMELGYLFNEEVSQLIEWFGHCGAGLATIAVGIIIAFLAYKHAQRRRSIQPALDTASEVLATIPKG